MATTARMIRYSVMAMARRPTEVCRNIFILSYSFLEFTCWCIYNLGSSCNSVLCRNLMTGYDLKASKKNRFFVIKTPPGLLDGLGASGCYSTTCAAVIRVNSFDSVYEGSNNHP
jgi:hypothetical protein